jgi:hypothetical protein
VIAIAVQQGLPLIYSELLPLEFTFQQSDRRHVRVSSFGQVFHQFRVLLALFHSVLHSTNAYRPREVGEIDCGFG